jgi:uncharacterized protein YkwD
MAHPTVRALRSLAVASVAVALSACGGGGGAFGGSGDGGSGGGVGTPVEGTSAQEFNLERVNELRASVGAPPLVLDARLNAFATAGSEDLRLTHEPHAHFQRASDLGTMFTVDGFATTAAENQGDPNGWRRLSSVEEQIAEILEAMWDEGPGSGPAHGHYRNLVNPAFRRLGVGLVLDGNGRLYFTNDFSG